MNADSQNDIGSTPANVCNSAALSVRSRTKKITNDEARKEKPITVLNDMMKPLNDLKYIERIAFFYPGYFER